MEHNDAHSKASEDADELERRTDALGQHIDEARDANERAQHDADLPVAVGGLQRRRVGCCRRRRRDTGNQLHHSRGLKRPARRRMRAAVDEGCGC